MMRGEYEAPQDQDNPQDFDSLYQRISLEYGIGPDVIGRMPFSVFASYLGIGTKRYEPTTHDENLRRIRLYRERQARREIHRSGAR